MNVLVHNRICKTCYNGQNAQLLCWTTYIKHQPDQINQESKMMKQSLALKILNSGENALLTGAAGAGKTYVLNEFIGQKKLAN